MVILGVSAAVQAFFYSSFGKDVANPFGVRLTLLASSVIGLIVLSCSCSTKGRHQLRNRPDRGGEQMGLLPDPLTLKLMLFYVINPFLTRLRPLWSGNASGPAQEFHLRLTEKP